MNKFILFALLCSLTCHSWAQQILWTDIPEANIPSASETDYQSNLTSYRTFTLDLGSTQALLLNAPSENNSSSTVSIELPMPDGTSERFKVEYSPVMHPGLAARYPSIRAYKIVAVDNPRIKGRLDCSPYGLNAFIFTEKGELYIHPYKQNDPDYYVAYYNSAIQFTDGYTHAHVASHGIDTHISPNPADLTVSERDDTPVEVYIYELALACTGEYGLAKGGTVEAVMATFNTAVNTVNSIFEQEVGTRLVLIENNDELIFLDPNSDPYNNANDASALINQNTNAILNTLGSTLDAFDMGHVFTNGCIDNIGGLSNLSQVCNDGRARGVTCHSNSDVQGIAIRIMAHELGHQFSMGHTWNNCPDSEDQYEPQSAYEPGAGTTIMSYSGTCGDQNIQFNTDPYYSVGSLEEFYAFTRLGLGAECATVETTANNEPEVVLNYEDGFYIPISTPFELRANGSDEDDDPVSYCWEQFNLGPYSPIGSPVGNAPIFRSYPPTNSPVRIFPRIQTIIANETDIAELLPTYSRDLSFRCTVRDNNDDVAGVVWEQVDFLATETAGPFLVEGPNTGNEVWEVGDYVEVTWDVANTTNSLVNCQNVNIVLSITGGTNFTVPLAENVPNDGSEFVTVPNFVTGIARVKVEAADNIFFDISNENFEITPASTAGFAVSVTPSAQQICLPEIVEIEIATDSLLSFSNPITLDVTDGLPTDANFSFSSNPVLPGESTTLTIDMSTVNSDGAFLVELTATADSADTEVRIIDFEVISNDFSDLSLLTPVNGESSILLSTEFTWDAAAGADTYDIEIATSPTFGNTIIDGAANITGTSFTPTVLFEESTLYFWRIRPINECGKGDYLTPFSFNTINSSCTPFVATTVPVAISGTGTPTVTSTLNVNISGAISDINIPAFTGSYQPVNSIELTLISPEGTRVLLFDENCGNTLNFNLGFDDDAPSEIACPPDDAIVNRPAESLSAFNGEDTQGEWVMEMKVTEVGFGGGGSLDSWEIEFCASSIPNAPFLVTNDTLKTPPGVENTITVNVLEVQDEDNTPEELEYVLVTVPENGVLFFLGNALQVGDVFRQSTINALNLTYVHDNSDTSSDEFAFTVGDGTGGWLPTTVFNIAIDEDFMSSTNDPFNNQEISVFPNPAQDLVSVVFSKPVNEPTTITLVNIHGQLLQSYEQDTILDRIEISTNTLVDGVYFINFQTGKTTLSKKVIIQR